MFISSLLSLFALTALAEPSALRLLERSLEPPRVPYQGEMTVISRHAGGEKRHELLVKFSPPAMYRREITDQLGFTAAVIVSDGETEWVYDRRKRTARREAPADPDLKLVDPDEEYDLLVENFSFSLGPPEIVAGRRAQVLEVRSSEDGRLMRRLSIDAENGIVLRRVAYASDGTVSSEMSFRRIGLPASIPESEFRFAPGAGVRVVRGGNAPDYMELEDAAAATAMKPRLPEFLPAGYVFESVNLLAHRGATMLHYRYTDGIDVLSLYQVPRRARIDFSRGAAAGTAAPVRLGTASGRLALWPGGKILEWSSGDRFILIGRLGAEAMRRVALSLREPGVSGERVPPPNETGSGLREPGVSGERVPPPNETGSGLREAEISARDPLAPAEADSMSSVAR